MLLRYFGEKNKNNCEQCDTCIEKKRKISLDTTSFDSIKQQIIELLTAESLTPAAIIERLDSNKEKASAVLKYMIDEEELSINDGFCFLT